MANSYGQILRSLKIIGGSSVLNVLIGLVRTKVAALIIGPQGMGAIALYQSVLATASSVLSLGTSSAGTRRIAERSLPEQQDAQRLAVRALFVGCWILAFVGSVGLFLCRDLVAVLLMGDRSKARAIGWLAVGVGLTIVSGAQSAFLSGQRQLGDIARITVWSAILASIIGIAAVSTLGDIGVAIFVLAAPIATFLFGFIAIRRRRVRQDRRPTWRELAPHWIGLAKLGAAFTISGLAGSVAQLMVRSMILKQAGSESLGQFQAAWTIGMTYIGFVLTAMSTDFYPRLSAAIADHPLANRLINQQAEVALLACGPIFLVMLGCAPVAVRLLYSSEFSQAAHLLRWQILGDVLKVAAWPLGFILLASGNGRDFVLTEALANGIFVAVAWIAIPSLGAEAASIGFLVMYATYLPTVWLLARAKTGFRWEPKALGYLTVLAGFALTAFCLSLRYGVAAMSFSALAALMLSVYGLGRLGEMVTLPARLSSLSQFCRGRRQQP